MQRLKKVPCWRCDGVGDVTDDDNLQRFCPTCMGMGLISTTAEETTDDQDDGWYEDPQPARLSDG